MIERKTTERAIALAALMAATFTALVACEPVSIEGTSYGGDSTRPSKRRQDTGRKDGSSSTTNPENAEDSQQGTTSPDASTPPTPAPTGTEPPPQPVPQQPSCQSSNPTACFICCIKSNPGAILLETLFDDCLGTCADSACDDACRNRHVTQCNNDAACSNHHACLEANDCAQQNFCF